MDTTRKEARALALCPSFASISLPQSVDAFGSSSIVSITIIIVAVIITENKRKREVATERTRERETVASDSQQGTKKPEAKHY